MFRHQSIPSMPVRYGEDTEEVCRLQDPILHHQECMWQTPTVPSEEAEGLRDSCSDKSGMQLGCTAVEEDDSSAVGSNRLHVREDYSVEEGGPYHAEPGHEVKAVEAGWECLGQGCASFVEVGEEVVVPVDTSWPRRDGRGKLGRQR